MTMRKKANRKRWNIDPTSAFKTINNLQPFADKELVELETPVRLAWQLLKTGKATETDFHTLAGAVNVALIRSEDINALAVEVCNRAITALAEVWNRHARKGVWGVDYLCLAHVPDAIDLYEQMQRKQHKVSTEVAKK
jgi:hypothetical protein